METSPNYTDELIGHPRQTFLDRVVSRFAHRSEPALTPPVSPKETELLGLEMVVISDISSENVNKVKYVKLMGDGYGIYKPKSGECPELRSHADAGTYYLRERAAYMVDKILGFGLVPATVIREHQGEIGSLQEYIPDCVLANEVPSKSSDDSRKEKLIYLYYFDTVIFNSDRHGDNLLFSGEEGVHAIDNGLAFAPDRLMTYRSFHQTPAPEGLLSIFITFDQDKARQQQLRDELSRLLSKSEVDACFYRVRQITRLLKKYRNLEDRVIGYNDTY